jgi:hypothetical protein
MMRLFPERHSRRYQVQLSIALPICYEMIAAEAETKTNSPYICSCSLLFREGSGFSFEDLVAGYLCDAVTIMLRKAYKSL